MTTTVVVDPTWKDRIERALKHVSRTIDLRQRSDAIPILTNIANRYNDFRSPRMISESIVSDTKSPLYTNCSIEEITGEKLICTLAILPQIDQLPNMFTYVSLQRNFLCDTMSNLSDLLLEQDDEDVKNLLISIQSDSLTEQQQRIRSSSITSKRIRRFSKTSFFNDRNNEYIFDEEHLLELLKRLKQQSSVLTSDDESNLFDALLQLYPSSADLIRDRFGTIFESKRSQPKEFTPNLDNSLFALDTTAENTLHSYFMLFCRRCYRYDCFLHKDKPVPPELTHLPKLNSDLMYRPCHVHCYRRKPNGSIQQKKIELKRSHSELIKNGFHSKRMKSEQSCSTINSNGFIFKPSLKRQLNEEISHWLDNEKSLFRIFYKIFGDNICMIAHLLDKSCLQVYTFYLNEKQIFLQKQFLTNGPMEMKLNGDINHHSEEKKDTNHHCSPSRRSHSSSFRRQRSYQQILLNHQNSLQEQKRHTYYPCDHDRSIPCNENCCCVRSGNFCEKFCCCSSGKCDNRFPGCRCRSTCITKQCPCYAAARECDPDLCTSCGANDFHNEENNELTTKTSCSCHNVAIQRSLHKPLLLAESDVAGWGIFTHVNIQRNEFIAEYCGEILTQDEGELRGRMYDRIGTSFLFDLNEEYMVDATYRGNKIRFANHSINPNCYAKVIMVNGDHRIGIYSKRFIGAGEELFFDYRYGANHHLKFVGVEKNADTDHVDALLL